MRERNLRLMAKNKLQEFLKDESGATAIEYALIMGLIAVVIAGGLKVMGASINDMMTEASSNLTGVLPE